MESSKNIQKTSNCFNRDTQKEPILLHRFSGEYTLFLPVCLLFCKIGQEGGPFSKKIHQDKSGRERENTQFVEVMGCFCFNLLTINYHGNCYCIYILYIHNCQYINVCIYIIYVQYQQWYDISPVIIKVFMFSLTRDSFLNHHTMKPFVICQFKMFTFVVFRTICSLLFFL